MKIKSIIVGIYAVNCYIVYDESSKEGSIIDPGGNSKELIKTIENLDIIPKYILLTHGHFDHTGAVEDLVNKYNLPVCLSKNDLDMILNDNNDKIFGKLQNVNNFIYLKGNDIIKMANLEFKVIETPGHTPGGICFLIEDVLFSGDTLFNGSVGRTDFNGGSYELLIKSIKEKIMELPDNTIVLPGHGPESSVGNERMYNPFL
jgi:hydroxyacylglutathione hydrolase